jgi:glycosyltransferase involved in cell wall biosynthesis
MIDGERETEAGVHSATPLRVLYLTDNPTLGGTIRVLQSWLLLGRAQAVIDATVAIPTGSTFRSWLDDHGFACLEGAFPEPSKLWPAPSLWHAGRLALRARRRGVDLIHCNEHNIYPFGVLLRRLLGVPLICHVRYKISREFAAWAFGGEGRRPDALLWTSDSQRRDCLSATSGIVPDVIQHLVPLGVDLDVFGARSTTRAATRRAWGVHDDEIVIGQACALRARKRIDEFIDLVHTLASENPKIVGVLAGDARPGDESYRNEVLKHIGQRDLGSRFRWLGNVDDVESFDHAIDVFVSTSDYETFGNSVCEAMACARPVAAYRGGSVHEVVGDAGTVVADRDFRALVTAVRGYVTDPAMRRLHGDRARQRVHDVFSPAATLRYLLRIYQQLLVQP